MSEERKFLHDIASPLTTVMLNLEALEGILGEMPGDDVALCSNKLKTCIEQIERVTKMIRDRRAVIIEEQNEKPV